MFKPLVMALSAVAVCSLSHAPSAAPFPSLTFDYTPYPRASGPERLGLPYSDAIDFSLRITQDGMPPNELISLSLSGAVALPNTTHSFNYGLEDVWWRWSYIQQFDDTFWPQGIIRFPEEYIYLGDTDDADRLIRYRSEIFIEFAPKNKDERIVPFAVVLTMRTFCVGLDHGPIAFDDCVVSKLPYTAFFDDDIPYGTIRTTGYATVIPLPPTLPMMFAALAGLGLLRHRRG